MTATPPFCGDAGPLDPEWIAFLEAYFLAYFTRRNVGEVMACLDPSLTGFGTGVDELGRGLRELTSIYERDLEQSRVPMTYQVQWVDGRPLGPEHALIFCMLSIHVQTEDGPIGFDDLRLSLVIEKRSDGWKMIHHHLSEPTGRQEVGESFPLKELRMFNERLRDEVGRKTEELEVRNQALEKALAEVRALSGLIPICASCKKIRDDSGYWSEVEEYIRARSEATFTHGICPNCARKFFPDAMRS